MALDVPEYEIRPMRKEEICQAVEIWKELGFSEGKYTLDTWYDYDPGAFYVAATKDGMVLGVCAGVIQDDDLAFVGLYCVRPAYQRQGIGRRIWNAVMERVGDRNVGVNPVPKQLTNYRDRAGFPVQTSWNSIVCDSSQVSTLNLVKDVPGTQVQILTNEDADFINDVIEYDSDIIGTSRAKLLPKVFAEAGAVTAVAVDAADKYVCGFGCVKEDIRGNALIAPLYADSVTIAELLYYNLIKASPFAESKGLALMTIDRNPHSLEIIDKLRLEKSPRIARLYRNAEVDVKFEKVFAHLNFNFSAF